MDTPDDTPIEGLTVYLQWMNTKGIVSPIYKTKTQKDGSYIFDLSKDVELATGEIASFKLSEGGKFLVRTWVDNPNPKKYSVVKNGDMFGGAFHNRLTRKQESWDFTIGIERIVNANVQLSERPFIEKWLAKPENEWVRDTEGDGTWASRPGSAGVASGLVWNEVGEIIGGSPNEYLYNPNKGDMAAKGVEVVASYVNDEVARLFDKWQKDHKNATVLEFKEAQEEIIRGYNLEHGEGAAIAETVVGKVGADGSYRIPFKGLYGVSRDRQNPIAAISNKVTKEEYGKVLRDEDVQNTDTRHWDGIVNLKARHINYDYMYVFPIVENREVWMKMFETNMFQTMNEIGGILLAGQNMKNIQFAILAPRPIHDVTNYDISKKFAVAGNVAETKTTGLVPGNTYQVQWFKDGVAVGEAQAMTADANGEFGSVPITVPELEKSAVYTSAVFPGEGKTNDLGSALYADSFIADPTPGVRLHRNLTADDKAQEGDEEVKISKVKTLDQKTLELPELADTTEYKIDEAKNKYFVG